MKFEKGNPGGLTKSAEVKNPEAFAEFLIEYATDPEQNITALAEACGLPVSSARHIIQRLQGKYQPVTEAVRAMTTDSLIKQIESKLPMLLDGITKKKVDDAPIREIAVAFGVLAEKRQLLKGEPTQILTYEERSNLNKVAPAIIKEMERRGMTIDVEYHEVPSVSVASPGVIQEAAVSKTAAERDKRENRAKNR